jgi:hypothetical protein
VKREKMTPEKERRFQSFILNAFPEALVEVPTGFDSLMTNHPGDRHVLAAAIVSKADIIVTSNLKHFPQESLDPWGSIEVQHPDVFLNHLCDWHGNELIYNIIQEQADKLKNPPQVALDLLKRFEKEQSSFASRMLLYAYGKTIRKTALQILNIFSPKPKVGNRIKSGVNYEISEVDGQLIVRDKHTNCEILNSNRQAMAGHPTHHHVSAFVEMEREISQWVANQRKQTEMLESSSIPFSR